MQLRFAMLACMMSAPVCVAAANASERSAELMASFRALCMSGPPDFAALDAKATAMNLPIRKNVVAPSRQGQSARTKSWMMTLKGGKHELVASETLGPGGEASSCGVGAEDVGGEDMKQELIKAQGAPLRESAAADGTQRLTVWNYAEDETLLLADGSPIKIPGVYLILQLQKNTSR